MTATSVAPRALGLVAVVITLSCARHAGRPATATQELRVAHDYGLGGPGPLLVVSVEPDGSVRGTVFVRAGRAIPALPDSLVAILRAEREARFARVGCKAAIEMGRALACPARFRGPEPDWRAALRVLHEVLAADSTAERAEALARRPIAQPDGTIRIRGCNDCGGIDAEVRRASLVRRWRLGPEAAMQLGHLIDSLVARAESGRL